MNLPVLPSPQAPAVSQPAGTLTREWVVFLAALLTVLTAQDARIAALEAK